MLFIKEIEKITYQGVLDFCSQQYRESVHLDYKKDIDTSLAKTIAAMANTWGGIIVIGVEDEDSKPKLPAVGITYKEHLREQINNIILGNITPPLFPEVQVCQSEDKRNAFIVIRVAQSNLTPHAIKWNTKVYIRTDTSNEPEELASIDRILWLVDKRNKSAEMKNSFYARANERFDTLCKKVGQFIKFNDSFFAICPLYPFEILIDYELLRAEIPKKIEVNGWGRTFPSRRIIYDEFLPTQNGAYGFFHNEKTGFISYGEINHYGFFYYREDLSRVEEDNKGKLIPNSFLWDILTKVDLFLEAMHKLYTELGYWGLLELRISMDKLQDVIFRDLPAPRGHMHFEDIIASPIDHSLIFTKMVSFRELSTNRVDMVINMIKEISWAIGFYHIKPEIIQKLMAENKRI
jgi:hypothetical protein